MIDIEQECGATVEPTGEMIRAQLNLLVNDEVFRSSKRSVAFLRYVVEQTLKGEAEQIKERTIGVEVFDRKPTYDTNLDHIVRTAATELRKRLAIYYGDEKHRNELRMGLVPGSYIPRFSFPDHGTQIAEQLNGHTNGHANGHVTHADPVVEHSEVHPEPHHAQHWAPVPAHHAPKWRWVYICCGVLLLASAAFGYAWLHQSNAQKLFWKPVLDTPGPVLVAVGNVPDGPPTVSAGDSNDTTTPVISADVAHTVPFADAFTMARIVGTLESSGKKVVIRKENASSFSDLREGPVVLIGAFNNEWSLRLTRQLRYSLALDADKHLIYIRDSRNPTSRSWSWGTNQPRNRIGDAHSPVLQDYALISRIRSSETGHVVVVVGGLYTYGTQSAGEFLSDPQMMQAVLHAAQLDPSHPNLQIVLGTTVTDETPGPPRVLAVSSELLL
jgi:hypothetical protein